MFDNSGFGLGKLNILKIQDQENKDVASASIKNDINGLILSISQKENLLGNYFYTSP